MFGLKLFKRRSLRDARTGESPQRSPRSIPQAAFPPPPPVPAPPASRLQAPPPPPPPLGAATPFVPLATPLLAGAPPDDLVANAPSSAPARVRFFYEDGSVTEADPEAAERLGYLATNLLDASRDDA